MRTKLTLQQALQLYAKIDNDQFSLAEKLFIKTDVEKGQNENIQDHFGKDLAFITKGLFRAYYIDPKTGSEINTFFFQENQFMFSYLLFNPNTPCNYYYEALEDSEVFRINRKDLKWLYKTSHQWEHFGRVLAEDYYRGSNSRAESFIFNTPEERYVELIKTFPKIFQRTSLINISSYLGVKSQSLSRIRKRISLMRK